MFSNNNLFVFRLHRYGIAYNNVNNNGNNLGRKYKIKTPIISQNKQKLLIKCIYSSKGSLRFERVLKLPIKLIFNLKPLRADYIWRSIKFRALIRAQIVVLREF